MVILLVICWLVGCVVLLDLFGGLIVSMVRWFVFGLWLVCYGLLLGGVFGWFGRIARFSVLVCVYDIVVVVVSCLCFSDYSC